MKTKLFAPLKIRDLTFKNRIFVSPMCQYSALEGVAQPWHLVHLGARASGGAGLVMVEATGVCAEGRISQGCLGLWNDNQVAAFQPITKFIRDQKSVPGIQLAHAGRKASARTPQQGKGLLSKEEGAWTCVAPSAVAFQNSEPLPHELSPGEIYELVKTFTRSALLALNSGFQVLELHMAHGYLLHEFLSPLSNQRKDEFGGSLENRMRFPLMVARAVRQVWPQGNPLFVRLSASDWAEGGWDIEQSIQFCLELKELGVDLIDVSSGGLVPHQKINVEPGYQVPFAQKIKNGSQILTGAVGLITEAKQAEEILQSAKADVIFLARELLRNPSWPLQAAQELGEEVAWPHQYERAKPFPCI